MYVTMDSKKRDDLINEGNSYCDQASLLVNQADYQN